MTEPRNPDESDNPREGEPGSESWTWERPADGSPVYGDERFTPSLPPAPEPPPLPPTWQVPPPGIGPAQPGGGQGYPPPAYQQPPAPGYPPPQWPQGQHDGYNPGYAPPAAAPQGVNKGLFSLFTSIFALLMACCCPLVGLFGGIVGTALGWSAMQDAKKNGQENLTAIWGFWLSIAAIILALANLALNIYIQIFHPEILAEALRNFGLE